MKCKLLFLLILTASALAQPPDTPVRGAGQQSSDARNLAIKPYVTQGRATYPAARERFLAGLPAGEKFSIITRLSEDRDSRIEDVLVDVDSIKDGVIHGRIATEVLNLKSYHQGDWIAVPESRIMGWTLSPAPVQRATPPPIRPPAPNPTPPPRPAPAPGRTPFGAPPPRNPLGSVDRILAAMDWANIAFNSPQKINRNETAQIQLLLSLQKSIDELQNAIAAAGQREGATVRVSNRMEARLSGPNFQITAITAEEQAIGSIDTVEWKWEIKPTASGRQNLHLTLTALFTVDGTDTRRSVRTFDKKIQVEVTAGQQISDFFGKNWQWLWAAILLPIAGWLWKRWKGKSLRQNRFSG